MLEMVITKVRFVVKEVVVYIIIIIIIIQLFCIYLFTQQPKGQL
jgi:hypothetical protein